MSDLVGNPGDRFSQNEAHINSIPCLQCWGMVEVLAVVSVGSCSVAVVWTVTAVEVPSELFSLLHYYLSFSPLCN